MPFLPTYTYICPKGSLCECKCHSFGALACTDCLHDIPKVVDVRVEAEQ